MLHDQAPHLESGAPTDDSIIRNYGATMLEAATSELFYKYWEHTATHDPLTGLYNRLGIISKIEERVENGPEGKAIGLIFVDLDKFKAVNDNLGHKAGDRVLEDFGVHLSNAFRRSGEMILYHDRQEEIKTINDSSGHAAGDNVLNSAIDDEATVGRYGGDEVIILVELGEVDGPEDNRANTINERLNGALSYARKVLDEFIESRPEEERILGLNGSIGGAASIPGASTESVDIQVSHLLHEADQNMYEDKKARGQSR
jgi:diguanylate cyclase (GGDEF)-like protein